MNKLVKTITTITLLSGVAFFTVGILATKAAEERKSNFEQQYKQPPEIKVSSQFCYNNSDVLKDAYALNYKALVIRDPLVTEYYTVEYYNKLVNIWVGLCNTK